MVVNEPAVEVSNLTVTYLATSDEGQDLTAVDGLDLEVDAGEFVCIVGPSGCGKSTFLSAVAGLLSVGETGQARVDGTVKIHGDTTAGIDHRIAYMFQKDTLLPWLTVNDNVQLPMRIRGAHGKERDGTAKELLAMVGLEGFDDHYPKALSGGMRKRVQLAQAFAHETDIIFMDEPFGALDAQTKVFMQQELLQIWEKHRKTIVFVTHDLSESVLLGDRVLCMTARPGRRKSLREVHLPRPREARTIAGQPEYAQLMELLWRDIEEESRRSMSGVQASA